MVTTLEMEESPSRNNKRRRYDDLNGNTKNETDSNDYENETEISRESRKLIEKKVETDDGNNNDDNIGDDGSDGNENDDKVDTNDLKIEKILEDPKEIQAVSELHKTAETLTKYASDMQQLGRWNGYCNSWINSTFETRKLVASLTSRTFDEMRQFLVFNDPNTNKNDSLNNVNNKDYSAPNDSTNNNTQNNIPSVMETIKARRRSKEQSGLYDTDKLIKFYQNSVILEEDLLRTINRCTALSEYINTKIILPMRSNLQNDPVMITVEERASTAKAVMEQRNENAQPVRKSRASTRSQTMSSIAKSRRRVYSGESDIENPGNDSGNSNEDEDGSVTPRRSVSEDTSRLEGLDEVIVNAIAAQEAVDLALRAVDDIHNNNTRKSSSNKNTDSNNSINESSTDSE